MKLSTEVVGVEFQNPVLLASGTCGFGRELVDVVDIDSLGGFVTKSVTVEPRGGNPPPRVTEFGGGMVNSVGLANPGLAATRREQLPWIASNVRRARVFVSVAGHTVEDYGTLVEGLEGADGFLGFELNLSCPNDASREGQPFALDRRAVQAVLALCRTRTERPLLAKLAPNDGELAETARIAAEAGADGLTLVNTLPGALLRPESGEPELGGRDGGVSGPALRPIGLRAVQQARAATDLPIVGVGGILAPEDAVAYARAGASLVQIGTASFAAPRAAEKLIAGLSRWGHRQGVRRWDELVTRRTPASRLEPVAALEG